MTARKFNSRAQKFVVSAERANEAASDRQLNLILFTLKNPALKGTKLEGIVVNALDSDMTRGEADSYIKRIANVIERKSAAKRSETVRETVRVAETTNEPQVGCSHAEIAEMVLSGKLGKVAQKKALALVA